MMRMVEIGSCCKIVNGSTPSRNKPEYWGGDIDWFTPKDLSKLQGKYVEGAPEKITEEGYESCSTSMVPSGSLLFTSRAPIGHLAITKKEVCTNQGFKTLVPSESVEIEYLYYVIKKYTPNLQDLGNGATFKELSKASISAFKIPLPPLPTQKKIAAILDAADAYRQKTKALIAKYDELTQSLFLDMFGDPVTNPKGWKKKSFTEVFGVTTGKLDSNQAVEGGQYPFFTCAKDISSIDRYSFDQEALMLAGNNAAGVYDVKYYYGKFNAYQRTYVLTLNEGVNYQFFRFHLERKLKELQKVSIGSGTKYLTMKILDRIMLLCPNGEDQNIFTSRVKTIEAQKAQAQQSLEKAEELFNALLQRAFKGELV